eukprot:12934186-Prorocentrum_lima.AAC.1
MSCHLPPVIRDVAQWEEAHLELLLLAANQSHQALIVGIDANTGWAGHLQQEDWGMLVDDSADALSIGFTLS